MEESNKNTQENGSEINVNPKRSPFTKLDNKRKNLHSLDADRDEIAERDGTLDTQEMEEQERHNSSTQERDRARRNQ